MVLLSNLWPWRGLHKVICRMAEYNGPLRVELLVASNGVERPSLKNSCAFLEIDDQASLIVTVDSDESRRLSEVSNLALESLAAFRQHMKEICSLKHREYCEAGTPFIYVLRDPDSPSDSPYAIKVDEDGKIDFERVIEAVELIKAIRYSHHQDEDVCGTKPRLEDENEESSHVDGR